MARYDFRSPRLFVAPTLRPGATVLLDAAQGHYLTGVLRLQAGDRVLVFNGRDGEWQGRLAGAGKRAELGIERQVRPQSRPGDLHYLFSPLKRARLDYMVQKAVEMGVSRLQPVMTRRTQAERVNLDRMHANAIEAAEQCGVLGIPEIMAPVALDRAVAALEPERHLVFCDEDAPGADPIAALVRDLERDFRRRWLGPGQVAGWQHRRAARRADRSGRRDLTRRSAPSCGSGRRPRESRSGRASCVPIPPRWRRSPSYRRSPAIGANKRNDFKLRGASRSQQPATFDTARIFFA